MSSKIRVVITTEEHMPAILAAFRFVMTLVMASSCIWGMRVAMLKQQPIGALWVFISSLSVIHWVTFELLLDGGKR